MHLPNCWMALSALQGSSRVMWTRLRWFYNKTKLLLTTAIIWVCYLLSNCYQHSHEETSTITGFSTPLDVILISPSELVPRIITFLQRFTSIHIGEANQVNCHTAQALKLWILFSFLTNAANYQTSTVMLTVSQVIHIYRCKLAPGHDNTSPTQKSTNSRHTMALLSACREMPELAASDMIAMFCNWKQFTLLDIWQVPHLLIPLSCNMSRCKSYWAV